MKMPGVIVEEKASQERHSVLERVKSLRKGWTVFESLESAFRIGVVIADGGSAQGFLHAQPAQETDYVLRFHGRTAVRVKG
jgi:hypothetical protein